MPVTIGTIAKGLTNAAAAFIKGSVMPAIDLLLTCYLILGPMALTATMCLLEIWQSRTHEAGHARLPR